MRGVWFLVLLLTPVVHGQTFAPDDPASQQWSLDLIGARDLAARGIDGEGIVVAVLDSGVWFGHENLAGAEWQNPGYALTDPRSVDDPYQGDDHGWDFCRDAPLRDKPGFEHGTRVASTLAGRGPVPGIAPGVVVMDLVVICDSNAYPERPAGDWRINAVREALQYAMDHGADIIHMSLQNWPDDEKGEFREILDLFQDEFQAAHEAGILLVAATGNNALPRPSSPGNEAYVLPVGSTGSCDFLAGYSNRGAALLAPGDSYTADLSGGYSWDSGTSFAAPLVSGAAALLMQAHPEWGPDDVRAALLGTAHTTAAGHVRLDLHEAFDVDYAPVTAALRHVGPTHVSDTAVVQLATNATTLPWFVKIEVKGDTTYCMPIQRALTRPAFLFMRDLPEPVEVTFRFFDGRTDSPGHTVVFTRGGPAQAETPALQVVSQWPTPPAQESPALPLVFVVALLALLGRRQA